MHKKSGANWGSFALTLGYATVTIGLLLLGTDAAIAGSGSSDSLGGVAANITDSLTNVTKLITGVSYVAGMGFALAGIVKFKAHKDNPTQVPLSAPIVLVCIAAALLFLPSILKTAGGTLFGDTKEAGSSTGFETLE